MVFGMDKKPLIVKWLAVGIILLFIGVTIAPAIAQNTEKSQSTSRGNWLYVGGSGSGNYTRIQDAIDNASDGDTVFVFSGWYRQGVVTINKRIDLIGENPNTTIYDGGFTNAFVITENNVKVSGFNFFNPATAICIYSNNNTIMDNIFYSCVRGIHLFAGPSYNKINGNIFNGIDWASIEIEWGSYNEIVNNFIYNSATYGGLRLINNHFTLIGNNYFGNNNGCITAYDGNQITICNNIFYMNEHALYIDGRYFVIKNNNFNQNKIDASFKSRFGSYWDSKFGDRIVWNHNYWDKPRLLPKLIRGVNVYHIDDYFGDGEYNSYNIDWFPASQPNDIVI
jgi:parallel beta-helix repeat protein